MDLREQACWLLLVFESGLSTRVVNSILARWCKQLGRSLQDFFATSTQEWVSTCHINEDTVQKLIQAKEKLIAQAFLAEQLQHEHVHMLTVLDAEYPKLLKATLTINHLPSVLFYMGDLHLLESRTIAIIGSRNASEAALSFTKATASYLAQHAANVISGNARGVDRSAYEGVVETKDGCTTVVLPHGIHKLSKVQTRNLRPKIEDGHVLLLSQFHPDAPWVVSRAMERNKVVTGLAQVVIVAEADTKGGTWDGARSALEQKRPLYVRQPTNSPSLPGNQALIELGGYPLSETIENAIPTLDVLLHESSAIRQKQEHVFVPPEQSALFTT